MTSLSLRSNGRIRDIRFGVPDGGFDGPIDACKETLLAAIEDIGAKSFKYLYDFGDGWTHTVKIEKIFPATSGFDDPSSSRLSEGARQRMLAALGAMKSSVRLLPTSTMNDIKNCSNGGEVQTTTPARSMSEISAKTSRLWLRNGNADRAEKPDTAVLGECLRCSSESC